MASPQTQIYAEAEPAIAIDYATLLRLARCPACENSWTTYKAPRSKLDHIQRCARAQLIPARHIPARIQLILHHQALDAGPIHRHAAAQNLAPVPISPPTTSIAPTRSGPSPAATTPSRTAGQSSRSPPDSPLRAPSKGKAKRDALSSSEEEDDDSRSGSSSSGQQASVMPSYERWTRAQLENESERLGYPDGPRLATAALVARAQAAWARQQPASPSRSDAEPDAGSSGSADDDRPGSRADPQEETREDSLEWELNLLNPADHALFAASDADDGPAVRPCFESFSRAQLEREHAALAHRIRARPADAAEPARVPAARAALDSMPKTKPALARKVLRLWDALHPLPADPPAAVRIVSVKLDLAGLSRVMACLLAIDPALYLRILRFEPIQLAVLEDKVRAVLDQEFEATFAHHLRQREDAGRAEGLSSAGSSDDDSGEDALDEAPAKRPAPKAPRPRRSPPALSKHVLHADTLARWLDLQAISYFLLDPAVPRKPRY
ncbi:hypothetical protein PtA15_17A110 [Puccinia triticina]|uniref:Uncharacterized protein n=1 Tax=Puccinia triticina TaxID=208348 RepID=A0ABY7D6E8_9BASI|nr:uncharacterized protein PtA15_17A110 [Puccinia triticina]WAQ92628.1 hypothetical protein PtA15_17A110 [Puccinia triticina]